MDPRLLEVVSPAVARAAETSGVARRPIADYKEYVERLQSIGATCSSGVCFPLLMNSRQMLERLAQRMGYDLTDREATEMVDAPVGAYHP